MAQSSVTIFGVADLAYNRLSATGAGSLDRLAGDRLASSRLGFRGVEDLGGGMKASFWFEAGFGPDSGAGQNTTSNSGILAQSATTGSGTAGAGNASSSANGQQGLTFNRRSTISLESSFGEIRLGRDYVPHFWNHTVFDPFGTNGSGAASNVILGTLNPAGVAVAPPGSPKPLVRSSNSIGYFLPGGLGGLYGQAMYAFAETPDNCTAVNVNSPANAANGCAGADGDGRYMGFRLGYAAGPLNVAAAYGQTKYANSAVAAAAGLTGTQFRGDYTAMNIAGQYDLGVARAMFQWGTQEQAANLNQAVAKDQKLSYWLLGAVVPMGAGNLKASYIRGKTDARAIAVDNSRTQNQIAVGYDYNLSKRTALYGVYSRLTAKGIGATASMGLTSVAVTGGESVSATGFDIGIRHSF